MGRSERGAVPPLLAAVAAGLVGGATLGWAVQDWGVLDLVEEPAPVELRSDRVSAFDCPDGRAVASLARGDRVLAVGRDRDGDWIEIRSPVDLSAGAWLPIATLADELAGTEVAVLPVHDCDRPPAPTTTVPPETTTTSSSTTTTSSSTTTTSPPTTVPVPSTSIVTIPTTSTTANAGSAFGPLLLLDPVTRDPIGYIHDLPPGNSDPTCPTEVRVEIAVTDDQGVRSVTMEWSTGEDGAEGTVALERLPNGAYGATFQFPSDAVTATPDLDFAVPTFTFVAVDEQGAVTSAGLGPPEQRFRVYDAAEACEQVVPDDG